MVYKIGNLSDLATIPITSSKTFELVYHYARVLTCEYGEDRNVDADDGGYVLYVPPGTSKEEIKACFDYTKHMVESVEQFGSLCAAMYILNNEYAVVIVMSMADVPQEIKKEMEEKENEK